jgi:hypothetical protein
LMDGFNKNRNFFIITDDLKKNFKQMELDKWIQSFFLHFLSWF